MRRTTLWMLLSMLFASYAGAQVSAVVAASNLPDGGMQMMTLYDYDAGAYRHFSVTKNGSSIQLFDFQTSSFKNFNIRQNGSLVTVWDQVNGFHTYSVRQFGRQITIFDPQRPGYQTLSLFTAAPMASVQSLPSGPSPLGSALQVLGAGLQQLARNMAVREQIEEQERELAALKAQINGLQRQETVQQPPPPPVGCSHKPARSAAGADLALSIKAVVSGWLTDGPQHDRLTPTIMFTITNMGSVPLGPISVRVEFLGCGNDSRGNVLISVPKLDSHAITERLSAQAPVGSEIVARSVQDALANPTFASVDARIDLKLPSSKWSPPSAWAIERTIIR
jgi:hypothetical protein